MTKLTNYYEKGLLLNIYIYPCLQFFGRNICPGNPNADICDAKGNFTE